MRGGAISWAFCPTLGRKAWALEATEARPGAGEPPGPEPGEGGGSSASVPETAHSAKGSRREEEVSLSASFEHVVFGGLPLFGLECRRETKILMSTEGSAWTYSKFAPRQVAGRHCAAQATLNHSNLMRLCPLFPTGFPEVFAAILKFIGTSVGIGWTLPPRKEQS